MRQLRPIIVCVVAACGFFARSTGVSFAAGTGQCISGQLGTAIDCGGNYLQIGDAGSPQSSPPSSTPSGSTQPHTPAPSTTPTTRPVLTEYVYNGPNGPCLALAPATPENATVLQWLATVHYPPCPTTPAGAPAATPINPATLAVQFWQTIPLPVPHPSIPPGYAVTGKYAYLVTGGTTAPNPYVEQTPLGQLTIQAKGEYYVDWGDPAAPGTQGPYPSEGQPYPNGNISHVYDNVGTYNVVIEERWTATWHLAGTTGQLAGLHTTATVADFRVEQLQAIITN